MKINILFVTLFVLSAVIGCGEKKEIDPKIEQLGRASGPVAPAAKMGGMPPMGMQRAAAAVADAVIYSGEVTEAMNVPNYTYLKIKPATGAEIWTAVPSCAVKVGDQVKVKQSLIMKKFTSPSLSRTFDEIVFGTLDSEDKAPLITAPDGGLPPGHPPINKATGNTSGQLPPGHPPIN